MDDNEKIVYNIRIPRKTKDQLSELYWVLHKSRGDILADLVESAYQKYVRDKKC